MVAETWALGHKAPSRYGNGEVVEVDVVGGHLSFAEVVWRMEDDENSPKCEARARLIAAAPKLLAELTKQLERAYNPFEPDNQSDDYERMRALIAEATGVSP